MNQEHVSHLIDGYIDGALNAEERTKVESHLKVCSQCRKEFSAIESVVHDLHQLPHSITPPAKLQETINRTLLRFGPNHRSRGHSSAGRWYLSDRQLIVRIAAGLVVLIGAGILVWFSQHRTIEVEKSAAQKIEPLPTTDSMGRESNPSPKETLKAADGSKSGTSRGPFVAARSQRDSASALIAEEPRQRSTAAKAQPAVVLSDTANQVKIMKRFAGTGQLTGKIIDSLTGDPLPGAIIALVGTSIGAVTNLNGEYQLNGIPEGLHNLKVSYIGYQPQIIGSLLIKPDLPQHLDFRMFPQTIEGQAVIVTAQARGQQADINQQLSAPSSSTPYLVDGVAAAPMYNNRIRVDEIHSFPESRPPFNTEDYSKVDENDFKDALTNPLSTFSIDVDVASYSNIRRFINTGQLPPRDAVRIEEMINYFRYDYPQPSGRHPFSINTEVSECPWNSDHSLLLVGLQGKTLAAEQIPPSNLVFLLDVSGSMNMPNKLPLVKAAFRVLVRQLRSQDRVAIVVYAGSAGLVLPSTSGDEKEKILGAIEALEAGGSTAGGKGIKLAYAIARENFMKNGNNRVILATDGDFNVGISSEGDLLRLIEDERQDNIFLSVLGFGMGNLKDSKMEKLADRGNGNYAYIDDIQEARKVLGEQMAGTLYTIAKDVKIQIEFNPAIVKSYRLIGYENRLLNKEDFKDDKKDAGELGAGHTVTALFELILNGRKSEIQTLDSLKYQTTVIRPESFREDELSTVHLRYKPPTDTTSILLTTPVKKSMKRVAGASRNLRFASAVAMFGMILRESKFRGNSNYDRVLSIAEESKGMDKQGYNAEFVKLVEACKLLDTRKGH